MRRKKGGKKISTPQASRGSKETKKTQNTCKLHTFSIRFLLEEIHILVRSLDTTFALLSSSLSPPTPHTTSALWFGSQKWLRRPRLESNRSKDWGIKTKDSFKVSSPPPRSTPQLFHKCNNGDKPITLSAPPQPASQPASQLWRHTKLTA
jgi:hypothetical protein